MKTPLLIAIVLGALLVVAGAFGALFYLTAQDQGSATLSGDDPVEAAAGLMESDKQAEKRLNAPGVQPTKRNLDDIQRAREDLKDAAGDDAPERY